VAARATDPYLKSKKTQLIKKAENGKALAVNCTDRVMLHIFLPFNDSVNGPKNCKDTFLIR